MVLHGAGRVPDIEDLELNVPGVEVYGNKRGSGIKVNEYLQIHRFMEPVMRQPVEACHIICR